MKQFILLEVVLWLIKGVYFDESPGTMLGIVAMVTVSPWQPHMLRYCTTHTDSCNKCGHHTSLNREVINAPLIFCSSN